MWEDIKDKVLGAANFAQQKGEELAQLSKLRVQAVSLSSKISREYKNLGMIVYECRMSGIDDSEAIQCSVDEIAALRRELAELNRKIDNLSNTVRCDFCGAKNPAGTDYCQKCGEELSPAQQDEEEEDIDAIKSEIEAIRRDIAELTNQQ